MLKRIVLLSAALGFAGSCTNADQSAPSKAPAATIPAATPATTTALAHVPVERGMVAVRGGDFVMGCEGQACPADETPTATVSVATFLIDQTEVTQAAYSRCVTAGKCGAPPQDYDPDKFPEHPVVSVTWHEAFAFCAFKNKRLPTEQEWEAAARSVSASRFAWGSEDPDCSRANLRDCLGKSEPVGLHPTGASLQGALDLAGNVSEWVQDWYDKAAYSQEAPPQKGSLRVFRGGSFRSTADGDGSVRASDRFADEPGIRYNDLGFRCAK